MDKILEVFFINPTKPHYLIDISRKIQLAHTSVKRDLDNLVNLGIITESIEKRGKRKFPVYKSNLNSKLFKKYKIMYNFNSILESKIAEFIWEKLAPKSIVLFGSYSRGEDIEDSDIDIFVECKKDNMDLKSFEKKLGRKIELHFNESFRSYSKELKNNIINGIVISGFLEGFK